MRRLFVGLAIFTAALVAIAALLLRNPAVQDRLIARMANHAMGRSQAALLTDDALRVLVCGSSSPMPDPKRAGPCITVFAGGRFYVVDTGQGSWKNLALWQIPGEKIGAIFYTHFHSDHIGELGEFNLQTWGVGRDRPLQVYGPAGVERVVGGFTEAYALDTSYRIAHHGPDFMSPVIARMEAHPFAVGGPGTSSGDELAEGVVFQDGELRVTAFTVNHAPIHPAVGYRFDYRGRSVVISGDTAKSENLVRMAKGADVLMHEAQANFIVAIAEDTARKLGRGRYAKILHDIPSYHSSPVEAAKEANDAGVKLLVMYHLTPPPQGPIAERIFVRGVADVRSSGVELGHDGLLVELPLGSSEVRTRNLE